MSNPELIPQPFANNGNKNIIQNVRQVGQADQDATWSDGFPPVTMQPLESGGLPPNGQDFNGILNQMSQAIVHQQKGGMYYFDDVYATSIGGYSKGSVLLSNDNTAIYISTVDNNTINFNTFPSSIGNQWVFVNNDAFAAKVHTHVASDITNFDSAVAGLTTYSSGSNYFAHKDPKGFITQFISFTNYQSAGSGTVFTFPVPFPNACISVAPAYSSNIGSGYEVVQVFNKTQTTITVLNFVFFVGSVSQAPFDFGIIAYGY